MTENCQLMKTVLIAAALATLMSGCVGDSGGKARHRSPPQDPPDYHGVPTDDRPPMMLEAPPPRQ